MNQTAIIDNDGDRIERVLRGDTVAFRELVNRMVTHDLNEARERPASYGGKPDLDLEPENSVSQSSAPIR